MVTTRGADFGQFFDPAAVETLPFGSVTLQFADCNQLLVNRVPVAAGFPSVGLPMQRIIPVSCNQGVHVLTFYTYLNGERAWMIGPGTRVGNRIEFDVIVTRGTGFGPQFPNLETQVEKIVPGNCGGAPDGSGRVCVQRHQPRRVRHRQCPHRRRFGILRYR